MNAQTKIEPPDATSVYAKIALVQGELARSGIGKDSENTFDKYKFRGIDAVYNALAPLLAKHGLCVLPRIIERDLQERQARDGKPMFYVTVTAEFDFVSADDGSKHTVRTYGEAMDRSDKATNKAMSAAYKYAAFMAFAIPTEGDNDADAHTPEVEASRKPKADSDAPPKTHLDQAEKRMAREIESCGDEDMLSAYLKTDEAKHDYNLLNNFRPYSIHGPHPEGLDGFVPIADRIKAKRAEFAANFQPA